MRIVINAWRDVGHPLAGGSEECIDQLASGLHRRGHDVTLLAGGPVSEHDYTVVANGGRFTQYLRAPIMHRRHFRDADVVVDVANGMTYFAPLWRRGPTVLLVHHVHEVQWSQWFSPPIAALGRALERHAIPRVYHKRLCVTVSPSTATSLEHIGFEQSRLRIIPNGIDLPTNGDDKADEPMFLVLARLVPHKRIHLALEAWQQVQEVTGGTLVIAGDGPEAESIRAMEVDNVELVGRVSDEEKQRLLARAWLLIHPSMIEGWGLVVMEAAAQSTPTLGFVVPGVRDSVIDGVTGSLASSFDEFVQRWLELATDRGLRARLGTAARERAETFPWDLSVKRFEDVLADSVSASGAAEPVASRRELLRLFFREKHDPGPFYARLAHRSVAQFPLPVAGRRLLELGCGHGEYSQAFSHRGAVVTSVDADFGDWLVPGARDGALQGDATRLPFAADAFDLVFCSNLLEHTPAPTAVFDEIARVLRPGGRAWVSWTNWYSPWGGHEIVPLHYLGPRLGLRVWRRLFGEPRVNVPFEELWPTYVGQVLRHLRARQDLEVLDAWPRYYPSQRWLLRVPGLRELLTWNCVVLLRRRLLPAEQDDGREHQ